MKHQPTCQYCGKPANLATGDDIYQHRPDLWSLKFWCCEPCGAYVGCHKKGSTALVGKRQILSDGTLPLGVLANAELRKAKSAAHAAFDPAWRNGVMSRSAAYTWLASALGIKKHDCHIGLFSVEQCQRVIQLMNEVKA